MDAALVDPRGDAIGQSFGQRTKHVSLENIKDRVRFQFPAAWPVENLATAAGLRFEDSLQVRVDGERPIATRLRRPISPGTVNSPTPISAARLSPGQ